MNLEEDIKSAVNTLRKGGIILYPTDTVWGIGCDATNEDAVRRIYELKRRAESKSMLVLVDGEGMLDRTVDEIEDVAWQLIEFATEPMTIIYDNPKGVAPSLIADDGSLGIRITQEKYSNEIIRRLRKPIVSTSANISGEKAPATFSEISEEIKEGCDYISFYRRDDTAPHRPSNIIKISKGGLFRVIR